MKSSARVKLNMIYSVAIIIVIVFFLYRWYETTKKLPLPPGPRPLPIIGNLHQAPTQYPERVYHQWIKDYGPIFKVQYGLQTLIILGNYEVSHELLDKRSNIYSSRPQMPMAGECVGKGLHTLLMPYDHRYRMHQRLQSSYLNNRTAQTYTPLQDFESKQLLVDFLSTNDFSGRYSRYASSMIMSLAYGKRFIRGDEPQLKRIQEVVENFIGAARVGVWIVDALPVLNYLPKLIAPWKRYADDLYAYESDVHGENFTSAKESSSWNWSKQISSKAADGGSDDYLRNIPSLELAYNLGIIYMAGSDTQTITLEFFTVAALLNPQIMRKAQAELDAVVGPDRLPTFSDSPNLPYVHAIIQEVLRWRPFLASGMPHAVTQDDEYMGYRIPKNSLVIANHWALGHDKAIFPNSEQFRPERWIEDPSLPIFAWGFGRRSCPGRHVATNSLFITIARLLWAFDIEHAYEEVMINGEPKHVRCEVDPLALEQGMSSRPVPFRAVFKVRSPKAEEVVRKEWEESEKDIDVVLEGIGNAQRETKFG